MQFRLGSIKRALFIVPVVLTLLLSACGGSSTDKSLTIGSKNDADGRLLAQMYALLLEDKGYKVTLKLGLGQTPVLDSAIRNKQIDGYPEFTGTGLSTLKLANESTKEGTYNSVKSAYESQLKLTWLNPAYNLNDAYALCTSQANATKYNLKSIGDIANVATPLTLSAQADAVADPSVVPAIIKTYGLTFKPDVLKVDESLSFDAVLQGNADVNICYTTDPTIASKNFVILNDSKGAFTFYNPAPLFRDDTLSKFSDIPSILNPLEDKLTTASIIDLIGKYKGQGQNISDVAKQYLQSVGLLK